MDVMRMTLSQSCGGHLHKSAFFFQLFDRLSSTVSHTGAKTADQLEDRIFHGSFVSDTSFHAFRNQLLGILLEVTVLAAVLHRCQGAHATVYFIFSSLI